MCVRIIQRLIQAIILYTTTYIYINKAYTSYTLCYLFKKPFNSAFCFCNDVLSIRFIRLFRSLIAVIAVVLVLLPPLPLLLLPLEVCATLSAAMSDRRALSGSFSCRYASPVYVCIRGCLYKCYIVFCICEWM